MGSGPLQMIKELSKPVWIVEEQPANHCLKPCGPAINRSIPTAGTATSTVSPPTHPIELQIGQKLTLFKPGQRRGLRVSTNSRDNGAMKIVLSSGLLTETQTLMKLPNGITDPGELQWAKGL